MACRSYLAVEDTTLLVSHLRLYKISYRLQKLDIQILQIFLFTFCILPGPRWLSILKFCFKRQRYVRKLCVLHFLDLSRLLINLTTQTPMQRQAPSPDAMANITLNFRPSLKIVPILNRYKIELSNLINTRRRMRNSIESDYQTNHNSIWPTGQNQAKGIRTHQTVYH